MRSPEQGQPAHPRAGKKFEVDLSLRYLSPGAFTVLPPEDIPPADPPVAPTPYRLTPSTRRNRNQAFAIIAEPGSRPGSRSPSPTGRVSPFRGRGFNPAGSRHASPAPSPPPPEDLRIISPNASKQTSPRHSKIPKPSRQGSGHVFGEKVTHYDPTPNRRKLQTQLSQSLTNISSTKVSSKPPPSPRRGGAVYSRAPAFQRLSPIDGSSPEPSQSQSSPSRIPKSRSQPPSRLASPTRGQSKIVNKPTSRPSSKTPSRNVSRDPSPNKLASPTKPPQKSYKNVQPKVNSFSKSKPKVPPKPQVYNESKTTDTTRRSLSRSDSVNKFASTSRTNVNNRSNKNDNSITNNKANNYNGNNNTQQNTNKGSTKRANQNSSRTDSNNSKTGNNNSKEYSKENNNITSDEGNGNQPAAYSSSDENVINNNNNNSNGIKKSESTVKLADLLQPSTTAVVSSTTTTVTKPLKIDATIDPLLDSKNGEQLGHVKNTTSSRTVTSRNDSKADLRSNVVGETKAQSSTGLTDNNPSFGNNGNSNNSRMASSQNNNRSNGNNSNSQKNETSTDSKMNPGVQNTMKTEDQKPMAPIVDGRILSATSVSNAMNKMNDTVLDSQTLMKDHGYTKLSPAASAIIAMGNESKKENTSTDVKNTNSSSTVPALDATIKTTTERFNNNHIISSGLVDSRILEREVQRNMSRLISPDHVIGNSVQKNVNDRIRDTVVSSDVKPIKITVKEKPSDHDLQSGNVRLPVSATNGLTDRRPSIPPSQQHRDHQQNPTENAPENETQTKPKACSRFFTSCKSKLSCPCCKRDQKSATEKIIEDETKTSDDASKTSCFSCMKKRDKDVKINIEQDSADKPKFWQRLKCWDKTKVGDSGCLPLGKRKGSWSERKESIKMESKEPPSKRLKCSKACFKDTMRKIFCINLCCKKKGLDLQQARRASMISKKKSLTPTSQPPEEVKPKLDITLVEHTSIMRGAIPVLPVCVAWFCLVLNVLVPGLGTIFSGMFCLCVGKPRFSQKDGPKQRIGAFIINFIIGIGQCFTVLFCLVGWGWSIWWGVIMVRVAKKHRKIKILEAHSEEEAARAAQANPGRDIERGS